MGFDNKYLERIRKIGRKVVLPSDEIKGILESHINFSDIKSVLDFGAGSLFWSEYFARKISMGGGGILSIKYLRLIQSMRLIALNAHLAISR